VSSVAIVGAGPRGAGVLERLIANAPELVDRSIAGRGLVVHLIDPWPPGAGRVWRHDQSPLMRLNSMARDVTVWTDETVVMEGPPRPGPTLEGWARLVATGGVRGPDGAIDPDLTAEAREVTGTSFPTRRLQRAYLAWCYDEVVSSAPAGVHVVVHVDRVVAVTDADADSEAGADDAAAGDGDLGHSQLVHLAGGEVIEADAVVLAVGHLDRDPTGLEASRAEFAAVHGGTYLPPSYTADEDLSALSPGRDVIVSGFGLAFVDLMVLVTEERGGTYADDGTGRLTYRPSGLEPRLWVGSRRGVPYRAKLTYDLLGGRPDLPRYFGPGPIADVLARHDRIDFRAHVWPLVAKELAWAYYRELALGHDGRVLGSFDDFDACFAAAGWGTPAMDDLIAAAVPALEDRLDLAHLDRPLAGRTFGRGDDLESYIRGHIEADLARRADPYYSADLGLFNASLSVVGNMRLVVASGQLSNRSRISDVDGWWWGFFSYYSSGPPPRRLEELLALHRAGIVRFIGADMTVSAEPTTGRWRAASGSSPSTVETDALVDARLPTPSVSASRDPLVAALHRRGEAGEEVLDDVDGFSWRSGYLTVEPAGAHLLDTRGLAHPRRFAVGTNTSSGRGGAFARPRTNALAFRQNDAAARGVLEIVASLDAGAEVVLAD
jgi:uncharacterized NAD(P)/FAD-binding protein YdhS